MSSKINKKWAIPLVLLIVGIIGYAIDTNTKEEPERSDILAEIAETQTAVEENPNKARLAYNLAKLHYQAGHFATAKETLQPFMENGQAFDTAKLLMGELEYLTSNYEAAEEILLDLADMVYYFTGRVPLIGSRRSPGGAFPADNFRDPVFLYFEPMMV